MVFINKKSYVKLFLLLLELQFYCLSASFIEGHSLIKFLFKSYCKIGTVYTDMGDYNHGLEYHRRALEIEEKILGDNHPLTAASYNGIAWTYHLLEKYDEALTWAEKAVEVFPYDPNQIDTLATVYQDLVRYDEAMEQFKLCLKLYKEKENSEGIQRTEEKITALKELMNNE